MCLRGLSAAVLCLVVGPWSLGTVAGQLLPQHKDCPEYGCTPSGTFSTPLNVSRDNATVAWVTNVQQQIHLFPDGQGCVGVGDSLVCQSNGPRIEDSGYISIHPDTGSVRWLDDTLWFPTLPLMLEDGSVIGSDGQKWVRYTKDGSVGPVITLLPNITPLLFGLQQISTNMVLMMTADGTLVVMEMDGHPVAEITLRGIVERYNGTFIPKAPAVVNGNRFYVLTQFLLSPNQDQTDAPNNLSEQRLFAIEYHNSMVNKLRVIWAYNFQREVHPNSQESSAGEETHKDSQDEQRSDPDEQSDTRLRYRPWRHHKNRKQNVLPTGSTAIPKPVVERDYFQLLYDNTSETIFVALTPPEDLGVRSFWGIQDTGDIPVRAFTQTNISITGMTIFEGALNSLPKTGLGVRSKRPFAGSQLWVATNANKLCAYTKAGDLEKTLDLDGIFKAKVIISSPLMGYRGRVADEDVIVFGMKVIETSEEFKAMARSYGVTDDSTTFVVAIDTPENANGGLVMWMVPTPDGGEVKGQIIGMSASGSRTKDQLIVFSQLDNQIGTFFALQ